MNGSPRMSFCFGFTQTTLIVSTTCHQADSGNQKPGPADTTGEASGPEDARNDSTWGFRDLNGPKCGKGNEEKAMKFYPMPPTFAEWIRAHLKERYTERETEEKFKELNSLYEQFAARSPDIGGKKNPMSKNLYGAFSAFAYHECTGHSLSPEEITDMCYGMMMADRGHQHPSRGMPHSGFRKGERLRRAHAVFLRSGRGRHGSARRNASQGPHRSRGLRGVRLLDQEQGRLKPDLAQEVFATQVEKIEKA